MNHKTVRESNGKWSKRVSGDRLIWTIQQRVDKRCGRGGEVVRYRGTEKWKKDSLFSEMMRMSSLHMTLSSNNRRRQCLEEDTSRGRVPQVPWYLC